MPGGKRKGEVRRTRKAAKPSTSDGRGKEPKRGKKPKTSTAGAAPASRASSTSGRRKRTEATHAKPASRRRKAPAPALSTTELRRKLKLARDAAKAAPARTERRWLDGCERWRRHFGDVVGREALLKAGAPPSATKGTPWAMVARVSGFDGLMTWNAAFRGFERVRDDDRATELIGANRFCRISALYHGVESRGGARLVRRDFVLSEIAPYEVCLARALERLDPDSEESITAHYGEHTEFPTTVLALYLWISVDAAKTPPGF